MNCDYCGQPINEPIAMLVYPGGPEWSASYFQPCMVDGAPAGDLVAHAYQPSNPDGCPYKLWQQSVAGQ